jgi:hypothetical protein
MFNISDKPFVFAGKKASFINAQITDVSIDEDTNKVFVDCVDDRGEFYREVFVLLPVGGGMNTWGNLPVEVDNQVVIFTPAEGEPMVIGSQFKPNDVDVISEQTVATDADSDVIEYSTSDYVVSNYNSEMTLAKLNGLILNTNQDARLQLNGDNSVFRISKGGATIDNPLNGQQFIDTLFSYLALLEAKVNANSAAIGAQAPYSSAAATAAAGVHTAAAATATGAGNAVLAASETAAAEQDAAAAANITSTASTAATALTTTSAQTKTQAEGNLNLNIKIP